MNVENINIYAGKTILVAPLDWGLGHVTRCVPIIKALLKVQAHVIIAAENKAAFLFEQEFPELAIIPLRGYRIRYSKSKFFFSGMILWQCPKIISTIRYENKWLKKTIAEHKIDIVISDNRFGLYNKKLPCVFITHQLQIQTGNKFFNLLVKKINYAFIEKFSECWIPDERQDGGAAGLLSHPAILPGIPTKYIGLLSRFKAGACDKKQDLLILLSGPEPQRTILEKIMLQQLKSSSLSALVVRGLPGESMEKKIDDPKIQMVSHLPARNLNNAILASEIVIARAGYSTIMDLLVLGKKAILIPTPGQKEQEYLAAYLKKKKWFYSCTQSEFELNEVVDNAFTAPVKFSRKILPEGLNITSNR
ncbi:MAG: glycosyltransferase [Ferruginibacter sp.]